MLERTSEPSYQGIVLCSGLSEVQMIQDEYKRKEFKYVQIYNRYQVDDDFELTVKLDFPPDTMSWAESRHYLKEKGHLQYDVFSNRNYKDSTGHPNFYSMSSGEPGYFLYTVTPYYDRWVRLSFSFYSLMVKFEDIIEYISKPRDRYDLAYNMYKLASACDNKEDMEYFGCYMDKNRR